MSDPFLGEIRIFAGNFAPRAWAFCSGQLLPISQNTALFSLLGTNYGGNGKTTFGLPNLSDRVPMFWGNGPGLSNRFIGETGGSSAVTLLSSEIPQHNHLFSGSSAAGSQSSPGAANFGSGGRGRPPAYTNTATLVTMGGTTAPTGGSQPHNNMQPFLTLSFIIALQGVYPPRS